MLCIVDISEHYINCIGLLFGQRLFLPFGDKAAQSQGSRLAQNLITECSTPKIDCNFASFT